MLNITMHWQLSPYYVHGLMLSVEVPNPFNTYKLLMFRKDLKVMEYSNYYRFLSFHWNIDQKIKIKLKGKKLHFADFLKTSGHLTYLFIRSFTHLFNKYYKLCVKFSRGEVRWAYCFNRKDISVNKKLNYMAKVRRTFPLILRNISVKSTRETEMCTLM